MRRNIVNLLVITTIVICSIIICNIIKLNNNIVAAQEQNDISLNNEENLHNTTDEHKIYSKIFTDEDYKELPIHYTSASYAYDTSSPEKATGVADYSFVAKVKRVLRTEYRNPSPAVRNGVDVIVYDPYTVYEVEIVQNIKGELDKSKNIEVFLHGGINEDGESCSFMEGLGFLNIGEYYILLPYTANDGRLGISAGSSVVSLGTLSTTEINLINGITMQSSAVRETGSRIDDIIATYVEAEKNSIVPENKQIVKSKIYDVEVSE